MPITSIENFKPFYIHVIYSLQVNQGIFSTCVNVPHSYNTTEVEKLKELISYKLGLILN